MNIGRYVVAALSVGVWMVAGIARADIRPLSIQSGWQSTPEDTPFVAPERLIGGRYELLAQWNVLPPEERQQMRQQMREHWQQMPPEQRQERRQEFRERWQQMPSEERQRIREEMRERGGYGDGPHRGPGGRR